jgi:hypothetical protein
MKPTVTSNLAITALHEDVTIIPRDRGFPPKATRTRSSRMGFVEDEVSLARAFLEYIRFPCQLSFRWKSHINHLSISRLC